MIDFVQPRVTTRAMIDPTRKCSLRCKHCYWRPANDFFEEPPWEQQAKWVMDAKGRGCDAADITGGEPVQGRNIVALVKLCVENGIAPRIISTLILPGDRSRKDYNCDNPEVEKVFSDIMDAGLDDWLISMHGAKPETHDFVLSMKGARRMQLIRLERIMERMNWCTNFVLLGHNQTEILDWANLLLSFPRKPKIANFINFNPHYDWYKFRDEAKANIIDYRIATPLLDEAIDRLEDAGIGVNLRYVPMCVVAERHRKNVCNDLQVFADFGEWDNAFGARSTVEHVYRTYSVPLSRRNEEKGAPCNNCGLQWICGGANRLWHAFANEKFGGEVLTPISLPDGVDRKDFWHYRKMNVAGLDPRSERCHA